MYPNNNISQTISDLSFVDYGSSSGKWRANKKINFDPVSFYGNGLILSGKDYFKKSFGNNSDNKFNDFLVEFYATGNNYEIDFIKNGQTNLSIERTGNSSGGFLLNYRGSSTSFSETGATGFYSFNFKDSGINPIYLFGKASGSLVYNTDTIKTSSGYFNSGVFLRTNVSNTIAASVDNNGTSSFNLDSFTIDFLCKYTGVSFANLNFLSTRTKTGVNYPSRNDPNPLIFEKNFNGFTISLYNNLNAILNMPIISGDWNHISITLNKVGTTNYLSGYTNGILKDSITLFGNLYYGYSLPISGLDISRYSFNNQPGSIFLDEIRMWSGAKSSGEINNLKFTELKSDPLLYNDPNLLYHVSFDEITTKNKNIDFYKNGNLLQTNIINNIYTGYLDYSNIKVTGNLEFDEFRFWSGIRTSGEISGNANGGLANNFFTSYSGGVFGKTAIGVTGGQFVQLPLMQVFNPNTIKTGGYFGSGFYTNPDNPLVNNGVRVMSPNFDLESFTIDFLIKDNIGLADSNYYSTFSKTRSNSNIIDPARPGLRVEESIFFSYSRESPYNKLTLTTLDQYEFGNGNAIAFVTFQRPVNSVFSSWTHVCATFLKNGGNWGISGYLNGALEYGFIWSTISRPFGESFNFSGIDFFKETYGGTSDLIIDEFRLWSGVKSSGEINDLKFKRLSSRQSWMTDPLLCCYIPFDANNTGIFDYDKLSNYKNSGLYSYPSI